MCLHQDVYHLNQCFPTFQSLQTPYIHLCIQGTSWYGIRWDTVVLHKYVWMVNIMLSLYRRWCLLSGFHNTNMTITKEKSTVICWITCPADPLVSFCGPLVEHHWSTWIKLFLVIVFGVFCINWVSSFSPQIIRG